MGWIGGIVAALGLAALAAGPALADCQADIGRVEKRVAAVPMGARRVRLEGLLERARRELMEDDETECGYAVHNVESALGEAAPHRVLSR